MHLYIYDDLSGGGVHAAPDQLLFRSAQCGGRGKMGWVARWVRCKPWGVLLTTTTTHQAGKGVGGQCVTGMRRRSIPESTGPRHPALLSKPPPPT